MDLRLQTGLSAEVSALVLRGDAELGLRCGTDPDPCLRGGLRREPPRAALGRGGVHRDWDMFKKAMADDITYRNGPTGTSA